MSVSVLANPGKVGLASERPTWQLEVIEELVDLPATALDQGQLTDASDLDGIEQRVQRLLRRFGSVLTHKLAQQAAASCPRPCCPRCAAPMQVRNRRGRQLQGTTGEFTLQRAEYHCPACGEVDVPADRLWQLGREQLTPALQRALARAGTEIASFERAADLVGDILQIELTADTAARTTEALGAVCEEQIQQEIAAIQRPQVADQLGAAVQPCTLLVGVDATKVHGGGRWRDAKIGVLAPLGPELTVNAENGRPGLPLGERTYCAGIEPADRFFDRLEVLATKAGWQPSPRVRVLLLGDGGPWIWERAGRFRTGGAEVIEILDLYHAREHVWTVAHALLGDGVKGYQWGGSGYAPTCSPKVAPWC